MDEDADHVTESDDRAGAVRHDHPPHRPRATHGAEENVPRTPTSGGAEGSAPGTTTRGGEGSGSRRTATSDAPVVSGVREPGQPPHRRLLAKASLLLPSAEPTVSPKRSGALQSLGDDFGILDAILGSMLGSASPSGGDVVDVVLLEEVATVPPLPSAPPIDMEHNQDQHLWDSAGPSGCPHPAVSAKPTTPRTRRSSSPSTSSTYSSTLSLRHLDLLMDGNPETLSPIFGGNRLSRGNVRATVIGGLPFHRRACRCPSETLTEISCAVGNDAQCARATASFRRPRSAEVCGAVTRTRVSDDEYCAPSLDSTPHRLGHEASKRRQPPHNAVEAERDVSTSAAHAPPMPSAPCRHDLTVAVGRNSPVQGRSRERRPAADRLRPHLFVVPPSPVDPPTVINGSPSSPHAPSPQMEGDMEAEGLSPLGQWPHTFSNALACLACTLGIFNISRFAIISVQFGANFILQFFVMSVILGIPLFTFHVALGQLLGAGTMDMWKISPIFQGIGVALILSQALLGIYSIVGVSWMLIYFRDSFITKHDTYRWAEPYLGLIGGHTWRYNSSFKLEETVADYFSGVVLQRHNVENPSNSPGNLKFQLTFNLAVVWMIVFIALSKGLKSYGKVVFLFSLVPILGMVFLCVKIMGLTPTYRKTSVTIPQADWSEFFLNSKSWSMAMTEAFYTWGLLGASAMQMASHNRPNHMLHKDTHIVTAVTFAVLILSAFLANTCSQLLLAHGYAYTPSSYERASTYGFLQPLRSWPGSGSNGVPIRWMPHNLYLAGDRVIRPGTNTRQQSGYQALRLATELVPATLAVLGSDRLSPFWSVLFYFIFILFGIAQQLAIMHSIITGIMAIKIKTMKSWETTITFFACFCGFILGLPLATELGIFVVYFMDYCVGGGWWIVLLYLVELMAVFMVRGRPYSGETVVAELFKKAGPALQNIVAPILSFTWNVILPVILMVQTVSVFKSGNYRDLFKWNSPVNYDYWSPWCRTLGALLQIIPLLLIPFVAVFQSCRYLSKGPPDIFDRIQLLYRPSEESMAQQNEESGDLGNSQSDVEVSSEAAPPSSAPPEDPPPKYTPPPSYTTATGARIAKMLRQSLRRSFRRIVHGGGGPSEATNSRERENTADSQPPPPDYAAVLVEINQSVDRGPSGSRRSLADVFPIPSSPFSQMSTLVRNSFRRAMRDTVIQSTSSERLVDSRVSGLPGHNRSSPKRERQNGQHSVVPLSSYL